MQSEKDTAFYQILNQWHLCNIMLREIRKRQLDNKCDLLPKRLAQLAKGEEPNKESQVKLRYLYTNELCEYCFELLGGIAAKFFLLSETIHQN